MQLSFQSSRYLLCSLSQGIYKTADSPSSPQEDSQGNNDILWEFMVHLGPVPELITQPDVQEVGWGERLCRCSEVQLEAMKNGCYWKERAGCSSCRQNQQGRGWGWRQGRSLALVLCRGSVGPIFFCHYHGCRLHKKRRQALPTLL